MKELRRIWNYLDESPYACLIIAIIITVSTSRILLYLFG